MEVCAHFGFVDPLWLIFSFASAQKEIVIAIADFVITNSTDQESNFISLKKGDLIDVKEKGSDGWWYGFNKRSKEEGWFPASYVNESNGSQLKKLEPLNVAKTHKPPISPKPVPQG